MGAKQVGIPPVTQGIYDAAWNAYLRHWGPLLGATLLLLLVTQVPMAIFFMGPFFVGMAAMCLAAARGGEVRFDTVFDQFGGIADSLIAGALYVFGTTIPSAILLLGTMVFGVLALIEQQVLTAYLVFVLGAGLSLLPVAATVLLYTPAFFFIADGEQEWRVAMRKSEQMVRANWSAWTGLWVVLGLAHLFGVLLCCLPGIFITSWLGVAIGMLFGVLLCCLLSIFITPWMGVAVGMLYDRLREVRPAPEAAPAAPPAPPPIPGLR